MKITAEILFYQLSKKHRLQTEHVGTHGLPVHGIQIWETDVKMDSQTLYILKKGDALSRNMEEAPGSFLVLGSPHIPLPEFLPGDTYAVLEERRPELLQIELLELYSGLVRWNAWFSEAILRKEDAREFMARGRDMLEWNYAVIDTDLKNLYSTPDYTSHWGEDTDHMPRELSSSLLMNPNFHAVAKLTESFYYYTDSNGMESLCGNIFLSGAYYARLVMDVGPKDSRIHPGAREIFEGFLAHLEELFKYNTDFIGRGAKDQLHSLVQALAAGEKPALFIQSGVLEKVGWKKEDLYTVIQFRFYEASGWNTQLATALPFLSRELEIEWPNSCAVIDGLAILWVINRSLSKEDENPHMFRQRLASFVREHVCHAGISPQFRDFSLIPFGVRAADAAFRLGQTRHPHFWYYHFDNYRLEYMLEQTGRELPASMLCHPAIHKLMAYDETHHTELALTLRIYLQCNLNMTEAARQLYVHRTTFCRRMDHIRQLTELDMQDPDTILTLLLSYRFLKP